MKPSMEHLHDEVYILSPSGNAIAIKTDLSSVLDYSREYGGIKDTEVTDYTKVIHAPCFAASVTIHFNDGHRACTRFIHLVDALIWIKSLKQSAHFKQAMSIDDAKAPSFAQVEEVEEA